MRPVCFTSRFVTFSAATGCVAALLATGLASPLCAQESLERLERSLDHPPADPAIEEARPSAEPGYLGVIVNDTPRASGVLVTQVRRDTPADQAGLQAGDVIASVGGVDTPTIDAFGAAVERLAAGDRAVLEVLRDVRRLELAAVLAPRPGAPAEITPPAEDDAGSAPPAIVYHAGRPVLGLRVAPWRARSYGLFGSRTESGVLVEDVVPASPADRHNVPRGAIILAFNGIPVAHPGDLAALMRRVAVDRPIELTYVLGGRTYRQVISLLPAAKPDAGVDAAPPKPPRPPAKPERVDDPLKLKPPEVVVPEPPPEGTASEDEPPKKPETALRLPRREGVAKVRADEEDDARIEALQRELDTLRRRAEEIEATLEKLRKEADKLE